MLYPQVWLILDDKIVADLRTPRAPSVAERLQDLVGTAVAAGADAVLLTCSSISEYAAGLSESAGIPVLRVDEAVADAAVAAGRVRPRAHQPRAGRPARQGSARAVTTVLAVDQGTQSTKVLLVGRDHAVTARAAVALDRDFPRPGWVEQDAEAIWASVVEAAEGVAGTGADAIALSTQTETVLAWDAGTGRPLGPALSWQDQRAVEVCERLADLPNIGILLDFGHALYGGESPADSAQLAIDYGRLFGMDVNDNLRSWDDDMIAGSVHPMELFEFFYFLRKNGWEGVRQLDQFPFREDTVAAAKQAIRFLRRVEAGLDRLDFEAMQDAQDAVEATRLASDALFGDLAH